MPASPTVPPSSRFTNRGLSENDTIDSTGSVVGPMAGQGCGPTKHPPELKHRHATSPEGGGGGDAEIGMRSSQISRGMEMAGQREPLLSDKSCNEAKTNSAQEGNADASASRGGDSAEDRVPARAAAAFDVRGPVATWLDSLNPRLKFAVIVGFVMVFFGLHNILQEALFAMEGFNFGWSLSMLEAVGVLAGSLLERVHEGTYVERVAPFRSYVLLAGLLAMSSSLSNIALNYIKYPTKVIFRSCKLLPTMAIAVCWRKKRVGIWEFVAASAVCAGLIIFAQANARLEPDFDPRGIGMVMLSVCADAFLPNLQEHVFSLGASRVEVTFYTNSLTVLGMLLSTTANGNLLEFLSYAVGDGSAALHMLAYAILSHVAIAAHMMVVKEYGGVTAVLVGNTRKAMTIALSFILFPKPFSYSFLVGGGLVLGGLAANVMIKERRKAKEVAKDAIKQHHRKLDELLLGGDESKASSSSSSALAFALASDEAQFAAAPGSDSALGAAAAEEAAGLEAGVGGVGQRRRGPDRFGLSADDGATAAVAGTAAAAAAAGKNRSSLT